MKATTPRWHADQAARTYDAAAPAIHPYYRSVQRVVTRLLAEHEPRVSHVVDLGGGSGRLAERLLEELPGPLRVTIREPSEAFRALANERLASRFGPRAEVRGGAAQQPWQADVDSVDAVVSTSALHHLEGWEKDTAFRNAYEAIPAGGLFINGDEYRPASDRRYRELLERWDRHFRHGLADGSIPAGFEPMVAKWRRRNLDDFGGPRVSGDDCHETVEEQTARLYGAGFREVETVWRRGLWAVLVARK